MSITSDDINHDFSIAAIKYFAKLELFSSYFYRYLRRHKLKRTYDIPFNNTNISIDFIQVILYVLL